MDKVKTSLLSMLFVVKAKGWFYGSSSTILVAKKGLVLV